jgi:type I restriction enzyme, S subunit
MSKFSNFHDVPVVVLDELVQLGDIELGRGNVISKIDIRENEGLYPIYSSSSKNIGMMGRYGKFMFDEELLSWSVDGGGTFFYRPKHKFSITNVSGYMRVNQKKLDYKFLYNILQYQHRFLIFDYQNKAHPSVIRELYEIPILPLPEQKKIASILNSVDEVIKITQKQINKLQDLKKSTMYEFFINYIAKTGLKDNRKSFSLSNLVSRIRTIENNEVKNILTISSTRGWLEQSERWSKKMAGESLKKYTKLKKGDFSYNRGNSKTFPYGCIFRMDKWDEAVVPNIYHSFEITNTQVDSNYLQQYFWSGALDKQLRKVLTSSARDDGLLNIKADTFFSLNVDLPSLSEQKKVASILTSMDKTIDDKKRKLTQIQFLKISLMQDLLTGKVRVKVN